jgi:hypothetical protein
MLLDFWLCYTKHGIRGNDKIKHYKGCEPSGTFSEPSTRDVLALEKNFGFQSISEHFGFRSFG